MTYADAAQALGMTPESIRQRARREHWRKQLGNEGKALILVPGDLTETTDRTPGGDTGGEPPALRPAKRSDPDTALALQARLTEMEARASELRADLEQERIERNGERERTDKLMGEIADLAKQLATVSGAAGSAQAQMEGLAAQLVEVKADRDLWRQEAIKPWWRRLVG